MDSSLGYSETNLTPAELELGRQVISELNQNNLFCHCRECHRDWVTSFREACSCGSKKVEIIACWQFPDD
jgi:hypothetical protein